MGMGIPPPSPTGHQNRPTEAKAADSMFDEMPVLFEDDVKVEGTFHNGGHKYATLSLGFPLF